MKKIIIASLAASIAMAGGFASKHQSETISVKDALKLNGDVIVVEIGDKKWGNVTANEDTLLRIRGEVDKDFTKTKIDVGSVEVIK